MVVLNAKPNMQDVDSEKVSIEVLQLVSRFCHRPVSMETRLIADLNLDSLDTAELVADIEDHFSVVIPMDQLPEIKTVGDIARSLQGLFGEEETIAQTSIKAV